MCCSYTEQRQIGIKEVEEELKKAGLMGFRGKRLWVAPIWMACEIRVGYGQFRSGVELLWIWIEKVWSVLVLSSKIVWGR